MHLEENIIETMNGCVCCTARGDLIEAIGKLADRANEGKLQLDGIIIETTGMADPAPVAQTFFVDKKIEKFARLDGIVTLVDAKHIEQQIDRDMEKVKSCVAEAVEQIAFADRLVLNKTDLVTEKDLQRVEKRLKGVNKFAQIFRSSYSKIDVNQVLNIHGFTLNRALEIDPKFLEDDHDHEHDDSVSSLSIVEKGEFDIEKLDKFFEKIREEKGDDIYRMKGVLSVFLAERKFVFQAVHTTFHGDFEEEWEIGKPRTNTMVFIGRDLDHDEIKADFKACLLSADEQKSRLDMYKEKLRFKIGQRVKCQVAEDEWKVGHVSAHFHNDEKMIPGFHAPYQVQLENGKCVVVEQDDDSMIRKLQNKAGKKTIIPKAKASTPKKNVKATTPKKSAKAATPKKNTKSKSTAAKKTPAKKTKQTATKKKATPKKKSNKSK